MELGTQHLLLDNATKFLPAGNDRMDDTKDAVAELHQIAIATGMHIHLVAHTRKPPGQEDTRPTRYDIAGTRTLSDQPDNIVMVWRNRVKERARDEGDSSKASDPDVFLVLDGQRHGKFEGLMKLWIDRNCVRFNDTWGMQTKPYGGQ
jgi:twinkle protein